MRPSGVLCFVVGLAAPIGADACSCASIGPDGPYDRGDVQAATWAFRAEVVSFRRPTWLDEIGLALIGHRSGSIEILLDVEQVWKGDVPAQVVMWTSTSCGHAMDPGQSYVVLDSPNAEGDLTVSMCGQHPWRIAPDQDLSPLGLSHEPQRWGTPIRATTKARLLMAIVVGAAALLPVLVLHLLRTLKRSAQDQPDPYG